MTTASPKRTFVISLAVAGVLALALSGGIPYGAARAQESTQSPQQAAPQIATPPGNVTGVQPQPDPGQQPATTTATGSKDDDAGPEVSEFDNPADTTQGATVQEQEEIRRKALAHAKELLQDRQYMDPTVQNLSKLYWGMGMFDTEKDYQAIDDYVMINDCQIYKDYYDNDFEWRNIHKATKDYLDANKKKFSRRFAFLQPVQLGRYNFETKSFAVTSESVTKGTRRFETNINTLGAAICGRKGIIEGYPVNVGLNLSRPLRIFYIPMDEEMARDFLARTRNHKNVGDVPSYMKLESFERVAFLNVRVRMIKFLQTDRSIKGEPIATFFASVEGYDVYEDVQKKKLLFSTAR